MERPIDRQIGCCVAGAGDLSRRIAAFLMLSNFKTKTDTVSQNSVVFKLADRQIER